MGNCPVMRLHILAQLWWPHAGAICVSDSRTSGGVFLCFSAARAVSRNTAFAPLFLLALQSLLHTICTSARTYTHSQSQKNTHTQADTHTHTHTHIHTNIHIYVIHQALWPVNFQTISSYGGPYFIIYHGLYFVCWRASKCGAGEEWRR